MSYHFIMAITSIQAVAGFNALISARAASVRDPGSLTQKIPALATPGVSVTLGGGLSAVPVYDGSGLLRAALAAEAAGALPSGTQPGATTVSTLQERLQTVLALNPGESNLSGSGLSANPTVSRSSLAALNNVISATAAESGAPSADEVLQNLIAQALNTGAAGLDPARAASAALGSAGVLNARSATDARNALDALPAAQLELAAGVLGNSPAGGSGIASSNLAQATGNDASTLAFNRLLAADLEEAIAESDTTSRRRRSTAFASGSDLLLGSVSLLTGATDTATTDAEIALNNGELTLPSTISAEALARLAIRPGPTREGGPGIDTISLEIEPDSGTAAVARTVGPTQADAAAEPQRAARIAASGPAAAAPVLPENQPAMAGSPTITRDPRYAETAAAMSMSAAVYRFQTTVSVTVPPGEVDPARTVQPVLAVPQAKSIR